MILIKHTTDLQDRIKIYKDKGFKIGFVPTMGALHQGHISLINNSCINNDVTVCSIFVNPTQFNNKSDFNLYPISLETDIDMLEATCCDLVFLPSVEEMYPLNDPGINYDLGYIEQILEGKFRPGHFQGVCRIVDKLLTAIMPHTLYLGQKDYQQCMVIKKMIDIKKIPVSVNVCETLREEDGLAMSSRNMRLNEQEREKAVGLIHSLKKIKQDLTPGDVNHLKRQGVAYLSKEGFKVDYLEIADAGTLEPIETWDGNQKAVALVAAFLNEVRLIDNYILT